MKNTEPIKAIPTEYKNQVYRSRSEARFAAYFDFHHSDRVAMFYEPWNFRTKVYTPDFFVYERWGGLHMFWIYECKPSRPNQSYLDFLIPNFGEIEKLCERFASDFGIKPECCVPTPLVVFGSLFREESLGCLTIGPDGFEDFPGLSNAEAIQYAKSYRYDLEDSVQ